MINAQWPNSILATIVNQFHTIKVTSLKFLATVHLGSPPILDEKRWYSLGKRALEYAPQSEPGMTAADTNQVEVHGNQIFHCLQLKFGSII